jgi:hypothetical protein
VSQNSNKSPAKAKGKIVKQPQESDSPVKMSKSPLKKLNKDVDAMKGKKGAAKEETK